MNSTKTIIEQYMKMAVTQMPNTNDTPGPSGSGQGSSRSITGNRNDNVTLLRNGGGYEPLGGTALYKSLSYLLQDMAANIANAENQGLRASFTASDW